jgi:hypothetical protein
LKKVGGKYDEEDSSACLKKPTEAINGCCSGKSCEGTVQLGKEGKEKTEERGEKEAKEFYDRFPISDINYNRLAERRSPCHYGTDIHDKDDVSNR